PFWGMPFILIDEFWENLKIEKALHSFYTGIENIFKRIALEIDGDIPSSFASHSDLLTTMTHSNANRSPVISETLRVHLSAYLSFRHVFRHAYSFQLEWDKMRELVSQSEAIWQQLQMELDQFFS
ncbi:hypothetical protein ACFLXQ_07790, partial [Chloroflexota bacterium]